MDIGAVCQAGADTIGRIPVATGGYKYDTSVSEVELLVIVVAAIATAALSAVAGAGGGVVLLVVILQFVGPIVAIPVHGVVQLVSNGTRTLTLREDAEPAVLGWYLPLLVPATVIGYLIADGIPREAGRAGIAVFALVAVWWPAATAWLAPSPGGRRRFVLAAAGVVVGTRYLRRLDPVMLGRLFQIAATAGAIRLLIGLS